jgi:hypothetical protein
MRLPAFSAAASLRTRADSFCLRYSERAEKRWNDVVPARITCPGGTAGFLACVAAAGPAPLFPCFFNETCIVGHACVNLPICCFCSVTP